VRTKNEHFDANQKRTKANQNDMKITRYPFIYIEVCEPKSEPKSLPGSLSHIYMGENQNRTNIDLSYVFPK